MTAPVDDFDEISAEQWAILLERASEVYEHAHDPYSQHPVGAALLTASGEVFVGCNVEIATYGGSVCAERNAVSSAVAAGDDDFAALCVVSPDSPTAPCGICRQVLVEFGEHLPILSAGIEGGTRFFRLEELLPESFTPRDLD